MERQKEYDLRQYISKLVLNEIENKLEQYYKKYKADVGFLLYYPLIKLESRFCEEDPYFKNAIFDRQVISWFVRKMMSLGIDNLSYQFDKKDYQEFEKIYEEIRKMYLDREFASSVIDMRSIGKFQMTENGDGTYQLLTPIISNNNNSDMIYYYGLHDQQKTKKEQEYVQRITHYLIKKHQILLRSFTGFNLNRPVYNKFKKLVIIIDHKLLNLCINRVNIDIEKMGNKVRSEIIDKQDELRKFIGFIFYLARIRHYINVAANISENYDLYEPVIIVNKYWLISKINKELYIDKKAVQKYVDYFKMDCDNDEGQLSEFPLIEHDDKIILISSSIMLNDWHFSIVNGHYFKKKIFYNREDTISISIVNDIVEKVKRFKNIVYCSNMYYEFTDTEGVFKNSDIDVGIYDPKLNSILIIECKWKDNVFLPFEDYITIEDAVKKIYSKQLGKHKAFLELSKENVDFIFNNNPEVVRQKDKPTIHYICVEKRVEFHKDDKHMMSIYHLLLLIENYSAEDVLDLDGLLNSIFSLKTNVSYDASDGELKEYDIGDIKLITDKTIYLNYCL